MQVTKAKGEIAFRVFLQFITLAQPRKEKKHSLYTVKRSLACTSHITWYHLTISDNIKTAKLHNIPWTAFSQKTEAGGSIPF